MIPARMDFSSTNWKKNKESILQKLIDTLPVNKFELLTFNREEMMSSYLAREKDVILLEIKVNNSKFVQNKTDVSLTEKLVGLLSSKMVSINNYTKKLKTGRKDLQTTISIDVHSAA